MGEAILYAAMRWLRQWGPVAIWAIVILASSNDHLSSEHTKTWLEMLFGTAVPEWVNLGMRKIGHVLAYGILGLLAYRAQRVIGVALVVVLIVSSIDEWHQSTFVSRTGTPWDVVLDCCAALLAVLSLRSAQRSAGVPAG